MQRMELIDPLELRSAGGGVDLGGALTRLPLVVDDLIAEYVVPDPQSVPGDLIDRIGALPPDQVLAAPFLERAAYRSRRAAAPFPRPGAR